MFPRWFLYAVEIPKGKIPFVSRQLSVPVAVMADASHFHFHFWSYML